LVVVAHPKPESLTHGLAEEFSRGLADAGHVPELLDLYATAFNPVLPAAELGGGDRPPAADVLTSQAQLRASEGLALLYPIWWGTPPAILQGWLQRVMTYGFAFHNVAGQPQGLLQHKAVLILNASGPDPSRRSQYVDPMLGALAFCGIRDVKAQLNYGISPAAASAVIGRALAAAYTLGREF
jgi:NAD(P)H dehydrogenase (quinone)